MTTYNLHMSDFYASLLSMVARAKKKRAQTKEERQAANTRRKYVKYQELKAVEGGALMRQMRKEANERCCDMAYLKKFVTIEGECWIWHGPVRTMWNRIRPQVRFGSLGQMPALNAMFIAANGRKPRPNHWPNQSCGNVYCIAPHHIYETNRTLEIARKSEYVRSRDSEAQGGSQGDGDAGRG